MGSTSSKEEVADVKINEDLLSKSVIGFSTLDVSDSTIKEGYCNNDYELIKGFYCVKIVVDDIVFKNYCEDYRDCLEYISEIANNKELIEEIKRVGYYKSQDGKYVSEIKEFKNEVYEACIKILFTKRNASIEYKISGFNRKDSVTKIQEKVKEILDCNDDEIDDITSEIHETFFDYTSEINNNYFMSLDSFSLNVELSSL